MWSGQVALGPRCPGPTLCDLDSTGRAAATGGGGRGGTPKAWGPGQGHLWVSVWCWSLPAGAVPLWVQADSAVCYNPRLSLLLTTSEFACLTACFSQ